MERPVQAEDPQGRQTRPVRRSRDVERNKVVKHVSSVPRKAAMAYSVPVP